MPEPSNVTPLLLFRRGATHLVTLPSPVTPPSPVTFPEPLPPGEDSFASLPDGPMMSGNAHLSSGEDHTSPPDVPEPIIAENYRAGQGTPAGDPATPAVRLTTPDPL